MIAYAQPEQKTVFLVTLITEFWHVLIDDTVLFSPLTKNDINAIVVKNLAELEERLSERHIQLELTPEAIEWIADNAYDSHYGARPLRRFITNHIENPLAREIIKGSIDENSKVKIKLENDNLVFNH